MSTVKFNDVRSEDSKPTYAKKCFFFKEVCINDYLLPDVNRVEQKI